MNSCDSNPFCRRLTEETKSKLCKHCLKCTYAKGTLLAAEYRKPLLILEGFVLIENKSKPAAILAPGYIATSIQFTPERFLESVINDDYVKEQYEEAKQYFLTDTTCAFFSNRVFDELKSEISFLSTLYDFEISQLNNQAIFTQQIYSRSIDETVAYALRLAKHCNLEPLSHQMIARITGKSRPAVSQAIQRLIISNPELFNSL